MPNPYIEELKFEADLAQEQWLQAHSRNDPERQVYASVAAEARRRYNRAVAVLLDITA